MLNETGKPEYPYQTFARESLNAKKKTGLIAKPGSGKTRIILESLRDQGCTEGANLILCSGPAIATWCKEIPKWLGDDFNIVVVQGKPQQRHKLWKKPFTEKRTFFITNYAIFRIDFNEIYGPLNKKALHWSSVCADEYHKAFRRRQSQTFDYWKRITQFLETTIAASGTSMGKDPSSLFTLFQFIDRRIFSSYWKFVDTWCIIAETFGHKQIIGLKSSAIPNFKKIVDKYIVYIPPEVIADQLPKGVRRAMDVIMDAKQAKVYHQISENMMAIIGDDIILSPHAMDQQIKLRKLLCCPKLLNPTLGMGAGYAKILDELELESRPHAIIFVPFRDAVTAVSKALTEDLPKSHVYPMMGQMGSEAQKAATDGFRQNKGIIVCTIDYAESWDAETCKVSYFLGYISNTSQLQQAEGRTERAISKHDSVMWQYLKYTNTIDENALLNIDKTFVNIRRIMSRPEEYINAIKKYGVSK